MRHLLRKYEGKEVDEKTLRLLQGIKTKHFEVMDNLSQRDTLLQSRTPSGRSPHSNQVGPSPFGDDKPDLTDPSDRRTYVEESRANSPLLKIKH